MDTEDFLARLLPHRLNSLAITVLMLEFRLEWEEPKSMQIYVEGRIQFEGMTSLFMNPILEAGALHARAPLEFLGLKSNTGKLVQLDSRQKDDVGIERFASRSGPLSLVTPKQARDAYPVNTALAEAVLAAIIVAANKGMAHSSASYFSNPLDANQALLACRLIQELVQTYLYTPLGRQRPPIPVEARARE